MNFTKSTGYHGISMEMIKKIQNPILPLILKLINQIINTIFFPNILKIQKVIPINKSGKFIDPSDYRGINLLSPLSKIFEKVIKIQILNYLNKNNLIYLNHLGGIKGRSADLVIVNLHQKLVNLRAQGFNVALIALDQSIFFDIISHKFLFLKLKHLNFNNDAIEIIKSYMKERKQVTTINTNDSSIIDIGPYSVAQGSILSGIFAMIYTLDIHQITHPNNHNNFNEYYSCQNPKSIIYVDDVYSIIQTKNSDIWSHVKKYLELMQNYFNGNQLVINVDKTQVMIIRNSSKVDKKK